MICKIDGPGKTLILVLIGFLSNVKVESQSIMQAIVLWINLFVTLLFYNILTSKNKHFLILPSSLSRYS